MRQEIAQTSSPVEGAVAAGFALLDEAETVAAVLSPLRRELLSLLHETPASAAGLARELALPRQKVNYHLRELERLGFVELAEERPRRGFTERALRPTAKGYWIDPGLLEVLAPAAEATEDRRSAGFLMRLAARAMREVAALYRRAASARQRLPTLTIDAEVRLASSRDLARLQQRLTEVIAATVAEFHDEGASSGRPYRVTLHSYPKPTGIEPTIPPHKEP